MPPIIGILLNGLGGLGIDPRQLLDKAFHEAVGIIRNALENKWLKDVDDIAAEMSSQGWTLQSISPERPAPPEDYVGRIQYKLWHRAVPGGLVRDWLRDQENKVVTQAVAAQLDPADHAHNVRVVIPAVLDVTFAPLLGNTSGSGIGAPGTVQIG